VKLLTFTISNIRIQKSMRVYKISNILNRQCEVSAVLKIIDGVSHPTKEKKMVSHCLCCFHSVTPEQGKMADKQSGFLLHCSSANWSTCRAI